MLLEHHTSGIFNFPNSCIYHLLGPLTSLLVTERRMQCLLYLQSRKMLMPVFATQYIYLPHVFTLATICYATSNFVGSILLRKSFQHALYGEIWKPDKRLWSGIIFKFLAFHVFISQGKSFSRYVTKRIMLSFLSWYDCVIMMLRAAIKMNLAKLPGPTIFTLLIFELNMRFMCCTCLYYRRAVGSSLRYLMCYPCTCCPAICDFKLCW